MNEAARTTDRLSELLAELTREEKISLLSGQDFWTLPAIERLGIASLRMSDGPTGLRSVNSEPAVVFPVGSALAATWNTELVHEVGAAIGREALAHDVDVLLAPGVNIQRTPLGGRNFEYFSEDPFLTGVTGCAFVKGVQSVGVGTSVKHFAANNQEHNRMSSSSDVDERTLREVYLAAFELIVREAKPWTVMASYNRVNGVFACENHWLLNEVLKGEWGFDGVVVSDWMGAKETVASAQGGLDLEMPGPPRIYGQNLGKALDNGQIDEPTLDDHVLRVLRLIERCGGLEPTKNKLQGETCTAMHRDLARSAAAESLVLLKNERRLLPIESAASIAVIGGLADRPAIQGGGSSQVTPDRLVSPLEALREEFSSDVAISYERGVDHDEKPPIIDGRLLKPSLDSDEAGLAFRYFDNADFSGDAVDEGVDWRFAKLGFGAKAQLHDPSFSVEWSGVIIPRYSGEHEITLTHSNPDVELVIDSKTLVADESPRETELLFMILALNKRSASITLEKGRAYPITLRYRQPAEGALAGFNIFNFALREPEPDRGRALDIASDADVVLFFMGAGAQSETEGEDRSSMRLPKSQEDLLDDVLSRNPNTVVILNSGGPVEMPWADRVATIAQAWLPGQEGGGAIAKMIAGEVNPSGKLPMTYPKKYNDNPSFLHYPGGSRVRYGEGLFVGYRHYDALELEPLFPFGHGLSYTEFAIERATGEPVLEPDHVTLRVAVTNRGKRTGQHVVQAYVEDLATAETKPARQLKAFTKVVLQPDETKEIELTLNARAFSHWDVDNAAWRTASGIYRIHVGSSSRDLPVVFEIERPEG
ncbi:glycoside hydrolase family 3 C-terminal domain-containing protein [Altererythrobacter lutimaris]|uniref:Glycoside hydrolase family 3 C-terminal domain-containing protein n=1 Tax=Altererythrobacter lutimaris TaxID=2743979 RepID=A0A850HH73_9SPHN|nr:glycoside hydrolase family 3 C-terminal domain-containing protein [Altererythrobacter lutimaris]NVE94362.1 glycoside hydrolase family 3 C-terminal domain-containing protein [Altererythrobacter lutimaris]